MSGVSVVVPAWNEAARLPRLLAVLAALDPAPLEVVVADGGSSDGTAAAARAAGARVVDAPRGRALQQNAGALAARGSVLWFLHADSIPPPDALAQIAAALAAGADGGCFRVRFPSEERARHRLLPWIERGIDARTRVARRGTGDQGLFARAEAFRRAGGFPAWPLFEDVALAAALARGGRTAVCPGPLVTSARRWLAEGPARTTLRMWALRAGYLAGVPPARLARGWRQAPAP